jgi:DNA replication protein DnaC
MQQKLGPQPVAATTPTKATEIDGLQQLVAEKRAAMPEVVLPAKASPQLPDLTISPERQAAIDAMDVREEQRKREIFRRNNLEAMYTAGERYKVCTLDNYAISNERQQKVVQYLRGYLAGLDENLAMCRGIVLFGPVGTGKDHLLFAVLREIMNRRDDVTVCWKNGQDWFGDVRDAMDADVSEAKLMRMLTKATIAVISDPLPPMGGLGAHMATMLYRVIDDRYNAKLPTFVSVNVKDNAEAVQSMGAATWDRLCGSAYKIHCNWASHRKPFMDA